MSTSRRKPPVRSRRIHFLLVAILVGFLLGNLSREVEATANVAVSLVPEDAAVQPGKPFHVGVHMRMKPGWHVYWKNPGDSGLPLRVSWTLPEGFSAGPIEWPAPERIATEDLMSFGYTREVLLPIEITPPKAIAATSVTIAGRFDWLECKEVCLPGSDSLSLTLPVSANPPARARTAALFEKARASTPTEPAGWSFAASAGPRALSLEFREPNGSSARSAYLFVDQPLVADYAAPQGFERTSGGYRLTLSPAPNASGPPVRLSGVLVVNGSSGRRSRVAVQVNVPVTAGDPAPAPAQPANAQSPLPPYIGIVAAAVLGLLLLFLRSSLQARGKASVPREPNA